MARGLLDDVQQAAARRLSPAESTASADRLSGHDARLGITPVHADCVHDPGHDLGVRSHIGRRDILVGANDDADLRSVTACEVLQLAC